MLKPVFAIYVQFVLLVGANGPGGAGPGEGDGEGDGGASHPGTAQIGPKTDWPFAIFDHFLLAQF